MLSRTTITSVSYSLSSHFSSLTHLPLRNAVAFPNLSSNNRTENRLWRITNYSAGTGITAKEEGIFCNKIPSISSLEIRPEDDLFKGAGLRRELMPKHVAGILDGNRRWAESHGKELDYTAFFQGYMALANLCIKWGIPTLSCFVFSTENWKRPKEANDLLFQQFETQLKESLESCLRQGIRVFVIGDKTKLPKNLQEVIKQVEAATKNNTKFELIFAVNYGGKSDITQAIQSMSKKVEDGLIESEEINEASLEQQLSTHMLGYPDPDLMIRTGGNQRVSNFLVWQMSHTEFYFTDAYGPDFGEDHFIDALRWFQQCDRLFGK